MCQLFHCWIIEQFGPEPFILDGLTSWPEPFLPNGGDQRTKTISTSGPEPLLPVGLTSGP